MNLFLSWHRFNTRSVSFFLFWSVSLLISQTKNNLFKNKHPVEAAKSNRLSSRHVEIHLQKICFAQNCFFLHTLFLKNEAQIIQNYGMMLFMSKQVSLSKISLILQNMKIGQKTNIGPFLPKGLQLEVLNIMEYTGQWSRSSLFRTTIFAHFVVIFSGLQSGLLVGKY